MLELSRKTLHIYLGSRPTHHHGFNKSMKPKTYKPKPNKRWTVMHRSYTQDTSPYLWLLPKFDVTINTIGKASCLSIINCSNQPELKILNETGNYMR